MGQRRDRGKAGLRGRMELDGGMSLCGRVAVMWGGESGGAASPKQTTVEELGLYMAGAKRNVGRKEGAAS